MSVSWSAPVPEPGTNPAAVTVTLEAAGTCPEPVPDTDAMPPAGGDRGWCEP